MTKLLAVILLAYVQSIAFALVSRARNRDNATYHLIAAIVSNGVWFATFRLLVVNDMTWLLFAPYTFGTVAGSLTGAKVSMLIERAIGAKT